MIELFEQNLQDSTLRRSSKGNQLKWKNGNLWYKADYTGYEGLAEYVVSHLLARSTLAPSEYVCYEPEEIRYRHTVYRGCKSEDFLPTGWQIVTLERLHKLRTGQSLTEAVWKISSPKQRLEFLVQQVEYLTGLSGFGIYMNKVLTVDAFFLNEDRHLHNVAVLMDRQGKFAYCPLFDHGGSLLSDTTMDYPMGRDPLGYLTEVKAKTFHAEFDEQLDVSEQLSGSQLHFQFDRKDVDQLLEHADCYPEEMRERVKVLIYERMRKYQYLFQ